MLYPAVFCRGNSLAVCPKATRLVAFVLMACALPCHAVKYLVPAYWNADGGDACTGGKLRGHWAVLARGVQAVVPIINPNSGPLGRDDPTRLCLPLLKAKGMKMVGYVATGYGKRSLKAVSADIVRWQQVYGEWVSGIFLDEATDWWGTTVAQLALYAHIAKLVRLHGFKTVMMNSGTRFPPQSLAIADVVVGYEGPATSWLDANSHGLCPVPSFAHAGDPGFCQGAGKHVKYCDVHGMHCAAKGKSSVAAIVYCDQVANAALKRFKQAAMAGYDYLYLTNNGCRNSDPYAGLPSYWAKEVALQSH